MEKQATKILVYFRKGVGTSKKKKKETREERVVKGRGFPSLGGRKKKLGEKKKKKGVGGTQKPREVKGGSGDRRTGKGEEGEKLYKKKGTIISGI